MIFMIREDTPMLTPDSLRKMLQMTGNMYNTHTKKNYGREDINGSQFSGTVENFGFEMLLESRKHKMQKPSLKNVFVDNKMDQFFDIQYSNMIETYDQQGLLEAVLKKGALIPGKRYFLRFYHCKMIYVLRSEIWGGYSDENPDSYVFKDRFYKTTVPPVLVDISTGEEIRIELKLSAGEYFNTTYYFYNEIGANDFIDSYEGAILTTKEITNDNAELPFIWMTTDIFRLLPEVVFDGNVLPDKDYPLLVIGTDGHDVSHIYPYIYGDMSLPYDLNSGEWKILAYSKIDGFNPTSDNNYNSKITSFKFRYDNDDEDIHLLYPVEFDSKYIKITLSDKVEWDIVRYDLESYHAETSLNNFSRNANSQHDIIVTECFDIDFSELYLHPYEGLCGSAESGIHVDILTDYVENAVPKVNGVMRGLGEFDGLPSYFKKMKDKTTHRSHVELYTIRDQLNRYTQLPTEKQTAAIILDSAIPQKELYDLMSKEKPNIVYKPDPDKYLYVSNPSTIISMKNVLSEVTFNDENHFGNSQRQSDRNNPKFIYHGNRVFSLGSIYFDPELETARVFYVNNDSIKYVNNALLDDKDKKPARTLARICDIPTSYEQLIHIKNQSPTYLFDDNYVRMLCNFSIDDLNELLNNRTIRHVSYNNKFIFTAYEDPNEYLTQSYLMSKGYCKWAIPDSHFEITSDMFSKMNSGTGYEVGDTFYCLIGGTAYDGVVDSVGVNGEVGDFSINLTNHPMTSVYNLTGPFTVLETKPRSVSGHNFSLILTVYQNIIDEHKPYKLKDENDMFLPPDQTLYCFKYDQYGNIWIYTMDEHWVWVSYCQITGEEVIYNSYDNTPNYNQRTIDNSLIANLINNQRLIDTGLVFNMNDHINKIEVHDYMWDSQDPSENPDLSLKIINLNESNSLYVLSPSSTVVENYGQYYDLTKYVYGLAYKTTPSNMVNPVVLPRSNRLNQSSYKNTSNKLIFNFETDHQPSMYVYDGKKSTFEEFKNESYRDLKILKKSKCLTFNDIDSNLIYRNCIKYNIYYYPEYEYPEDYKDKQIELQELTVDELLNLINRMFGPKANPFVYLDSQYEYDKYKLIQYILQRYPFDHPEYMRSDLKIMRHKNEEAISSTGEPIGIQPTGGFISLTDDILDPTVIADQNKTESMYEYIFIVDDDSFMGFENSFKVFDINDNDITDYCIIIWNSKRYIHYNDEWVQLI